MLDQMGPSVTQFFTQPDDYYDAFNHAQELVAEEALSLEEYQDVRALIVVEHIADGTALANPCNVILNCFDTTLDPPLPVIILLPDEFDAYLNQNLTATAMATVRGEGGTTSILRTIPTGKTFSITYATTPPAIDGTHNCVLSDVVSERVVQEAIPILIERDPDSPVMDYIQVYRDQLEQYRNDVKTGTKGFSPEQIPYNQR